MKHKTFKHIISLLSIVAIFLILYGSMMLYQTSRYTKDFNCVDMTYEIQDILDTIHMHTVTMVGDNREGKTRHMWIGIPILDTYIHFDATNLMFFDPNIEFKNIEIETGGKI